MATLDRIFSALARGAQSGFGRRNAFNDQLEQLRYQQYLGDQQEQRADARVYSRNQAELAKEKLRIEAQQLEAQKKRIEDFRSKTYPKLFQKDGDSETTYKLRQKFYLNRAKQIGDSETINLIESGGLPNYDPNAAKKNATQSKLFDTLKQRVSRFDTQISQLESEKLKAVDKVNPFNGTILKTADQVRKEADQKINEIETKKKQNLEKLFPQYKKLDPSITKKEFFNLFTEGDDFDLEGYFGQFNNQPPYP